MPARLWRCCCCCDKRVRTHMRFSGLPRPLRGARLGRSGGATGAIGHMESALTPTIDVNVFCIISAPGRHGAERGDSCARETGVG